MTTKQVKELAKVLREASLGRKPLYSLGECGETAKQEYLKMARAAIRHLNGKRKPCRPQPVSVETKKASENADLSPQVESAPNDDNSNCNHQC